MVQIGKAVPSLTGGLAGQAVVKNSAVNGDVGWSSYAAGSGMNPERIYVPGTWYDNRYLVGALSGATGVAGYTYYLPVFSGTALRIDALGAAATGTFAAGTKLALFDRAAGTAVSASASAGVIPGNLLASGGIAGTGALTVAVPVTTVGPGWWFLALALPSGLATSGLTYATLVRRHGGATSPSTTSIPGLAVYQTAQDAVLASNPGGLVPFTSTTAPVLSYRIAA